jgi:hypothetical protein
MEFDAKILRLARRLHCNVTLAIEPAFTFSPEGSYVNTSPSKWRNGYFCFDGPRPNTSVVTAHHDGVTEIYIGIDAGVGLQQRGSCRMLRWRLADKRP